MKINIDEFVLSEIKKLLELKELIFIDAGGYKAVYKALVNNKFEAIKIVPMPETSNFDKQEEDINRIKREIQILKQCKSPYIVKLGTINPANYQINKNQYIIYSEEFVSGETLRTKIKSGHKPYLKELKTLMFNILDVIKTLWNHPNQFIHRDIKPKNIISTNNTRRSYILLDLGIAYAVGETGITKNTRDIMGTRYYVAPEMLKSGYRKILDFRADLYTLGLTVYEYASGENPFARSEDAIYTTLSRIARETPQKLHELRNDLPLQFCNLIDQLLKKIPALRPSNIKILKKKLEGIK